MYQRMLVPIDGSHASASVVPAAAELASRLGCHVDLVLVEPVTGARMPHPDHHRPIAELAAESQTLVPGTATPQCIRAANERYVARHVEEFEAQGVEATGKVVWGETVEQILRAALELRSDVIAMATRKLSNFNRRNTGSIAEEVLWRSKLPVLLIAHG
ncbi:MAG TPA: universal stress protein [Dehalococcoidia bacterium]|jgi:nucleotide-binding universal stress UspA family protein|nr:universal stress protein [Dehalococcoidia bacterium]